MSQPYEVLPSLSEQEYQALKDDIKQRGAVMVPVEYDEHGRSESEVYNA